MSEGGLQVPKCSVSTIRIRGLAERADSPEQPLGPDVIIPESVPLRIEYNSRENIGTATLRRDEAGIWADAVIRMDVDSEHTAAMRRDHPAALWPKLAVGVTRALSEKGVITSGEVVALSLVRENIDTSLPPWEVVTDPPGECGICGGTLEYQDRYLRRDGRWTQEKVPEPWCPHCADEREHLHRLCWTDLQFCGCGDPESVYELIRDLLGLFAERWEKGREPRDPAARAAAIGEEIATGKAHWDWQEWNQRFRDRIGGGDGTYYAVLYWLDGSGLIEHGGSVGGSWLTKKGEHYLPLMRRHDHDSLDNDHDYGNPPVGLPHDGKDCGPGCRHWEASTEEWDKRELAEAGQ